MKSVMSVVFKTPSDEQPVDIINTSALAANDVIIQKSSKLTKKHGLIAAVSLLSIGLVVTCVLVAIRLYTDSQVEIVKYSMTFKDTDGKSINQTVSVADNSVIYHVVQNGADAWIVNDFDKMIGEKEVEQRELVRASDKNIQVFKVNNAGGSVVCFVLPLNRSMTATPDSVPTVDLPMNLQNQTSQLVKYSVLTDPISDKTFLGTRASNLCYNIPTYWLVKDCDADNSTESISRIKRCTPAVQIPQGSQIRMAYRDCFTYRGWRICIPILKVPEIPRLPPGPC